MKEIEKVVADNIKRLLEEKNINQSELAKIAGVSESTVGKWVLEKASPRMGAIQKMSDYFRIPKNYILKEDNLEYGTESNQYTYFPTAISAGLPLQVDGITEASKISISDEVMGRWKNDESIFFAKANGDSMDRLFPCGSLIAVKPVSDTYKLKDGDIVVFSENHEYSVKHFYQVGDRLIFKPNSTNQEHHEQHYEADNDIKIHGKVVTYIVNVD